jgi:hypothetical protein
MSDIVIRAESLSKLYKIGALKQRHNPLRDQLNRIRQTNNLGQGKTLKWTSR